MVSDMAKFPKKITMLEVSQRAWNYAWKFFHAGKITEKQLTTITKGLKELEKAIKDK